MRERLIKRVRKTSSERERESPNESDRVMTFDSRILYIFLKASGSMAVAAAADAVAW